MWGTRVVIPKVHQQKVQEELHGGHLGVDKMKALARSHVWCPHIDKVRVLPNAVEGVKLWRPQTNPSTPMGIF